MNQKNSLGLNKCFLDLDNPFELFQSLLRQIRIVGTLKQVDDQTADEYYNSRAYDSRIGAWASKQSSILKTRDELLNAIENYKKKYNDKNNVPRHLFCYHKL